VTALPSLPKKSKVLNISRLEGRPNAILSRLFLPVLWAGGTILVLKRESDFAGESYAHCEIYMHSERAAYH
jgi:hypothetical protein